MDLSVVLLLALLVFIIFLIWYMDPFDEMKVKTEYYDNSGFDGAGLVAQKYSTALRQRPAPHGTEGGAQLPRPNATATANQRGIRGPFNRAGSGRSEILGPPPAPPPPPPPVPAPPVIYYDPRPTVLDRECITNSSTLSSGYDIPGGYYRVSGAQGDGGQLHQPPPAKPPIPPQAATAAVPAPPPAVILEHTPESNVPTQPMGGLRRSKPLVSFDNSAPWIRARTRSSSLDADVAAERMPAPQAIAASPAISTESEKSSKPEGAVRAQRDTAHMQLIDLKDIDLENIVGGGAFGQVWKGSWQGTPVAVKTIPMLSMLQPHLESAGGVEGDTIPGHGNDAALLQAFEDEVHIFAGLRHPNICLFIGACLSMPTRAIITELVPRGSLWEALRTPGLFENSNGNGSFWPWWVVRRVIDGTCRGLIYLHGHTPPIIHRDLKSANVLLDESFNPKICDFGLARLKDLNTVMTANVGTAQWMSPEVIRGTKYSEKADIYSLAIVAWEAITGKCPFEGMSQLEVVVAVSQGNKRPIVPDFCDPSLRDLLTKCWHEDPDARPTARETLSALSNTHGPSS